MTTFNVKTEAEEVATAFDEHINGKTIIVTGPTLGSIGGETARVIAKHSPKLLVLAGRSPSKVEAATKEIQKAAPDAHVRSLLLDLASLQSVRDAAKEVLLYQGPVDVLINNAAVGVCPYSLTSDGFERQFATNHLGHFLFTNLIMPKLLESSAPRVVNVTSRGHFQSGIRFDDINFGDGASYQKFLAYGQSKTANVLFTVELASRYKKAALTAFAVHPGGAPTTNLMRDFEPADFEAANKGSSGAPLFHEDGAANLSNPLWKTLGAAAATQTRAAFDPSIADFSGSYLADCEIANAKAAPHALNRSDAARLWTLSEEMVGQTFPKQ